MLNKRAGTFAALRRHYGPNHPATIQARRDLAAEQIAVAISNALANAPVLTDAQADRLAALLRGGDNTTGGGEK